MNRISNLQFSRNRQNVKFGSTEEIKKVETKETTPSNEDEGMSTTSKALIALAALGAAGVGIYFLTRGKKGAGETLKETKKAVEDTASKAKDDAKKVAEDAEKKAQDDAKKAAEEAERKAGGEKVPNPETINPVAETAEEKAAREVMEKEVQAIYTAAYGEIKPYGNKEVVSKLQSLIKSEGSVESKLEKAKDIFMEEMGYEPKIIKIELQDMPSAGLFNATGMSGGFNYLTGKLMLNKNTIKDLSTEDLIAIIRHELDHFDKSAKVCKAIGVDEYKKLFEGLPETKFKDFNGETLTFNSEFWTNATKNVNTTGFETGKYKDALYNYFRITAEDGSMYSKYLGKYQYITNPLEYSAHYVEHSLEKSLNTTSSVMGLEYLVKDLEGVYSSFDQLVKSQSELAKYKSSIFDYLFKKSVIQSDEKLNELFTKISNGNQSQELIREFSETLNAKYSSIQGSILGADTKFEIKVLQKMSELAKVQIPQNEIIEALHDAENSYFLGLRDMFTPAESKPILKEKFLEANKNMLEYLENNNIDKPLTKLQLMLRQIVVDKDITQLSFIGRTSLDEFGISQELLDKIYSNKCFAETFEKNKDKLTKEKLLLINLKHNAPQM